MKTITKEVLKDIMISVNKWQALEDQEVIYTGAIKFREDEEDYDWRLLNKPEGYEHYNIFFNGGECFAYLPEDCEGSFVTTCIE